MSTINPHTVHPKALLALADGSLFEGYLLGKAGIATGEVVFHTGMTGYQEIFTDPSYHSQIICFTYPHIGNTGINSKDSQSISMHLNGVILRERPTHASNYRSEINLNTYLEDQGITGIWGVDTRKLTRHISQTGSQNSCILSGDHLDTQKAIHYAQQCPPLTKKHLSTEVSCAKTYTWETSSLQLDNHKPVNTHELHVVVLDFGVKHENLRILKDLGAQITVVPALTPYAHIESLNPDFVFLSNGPGDPEACKQELTVIKQLIRSQIPVLGVCLGCQLIALACGAQTHKMLFGHHGANHPVQDLSTKKVMITSQNHGFCIRDDNLPPDLVVTHRSLFDGTIQGIKHRSKPILGLQGHPEAGPGPHDWRDQFHHFISSLPSHSVIG